MDRKMFKDLNGVRKQSLPVQIRPVNAFIHIFFYTFLLFYHYEENCSSGYSYRLSRYDLLVVKMNF